MAHSATWRSYGSVRSAGAAIVEPSQPIVTRIVCIALAIPLIRRRVKPNALYGLRVPATFADEWVWYEANAKSGRDLLIVGILQFVMALALAMAPRINEATYSIVNAAILTVAVV